MEEDKIMEENSVEINESEELTENSNEIVQESRKQIKHTRLPLSKIKSIIKMDPDVSIVSGDAVFAITKATELFIDSLTKEAYTYTAKGKRKTVTKKDFDNVIDTVDCLCFLEGALNF